MVNEARAETPTPSLNLPALAIEPLPHPHLLGAGLGRGGVRNDGVGERDSEAGLPVAFERRLASAAQSVRARGSLGTG
jgi:hypothetical protein